MKIKLILLFLLISSFHLAQNLVILNSETKQPIENVIVFKGNILIGKSNYLGEIESNYSQNNSNSTLTLIHPTIETQSISIYDISNNEIFVKQLRKNNVEINTDSDKEYIVITGYFNILNTTNGGFRRYIDGIIQNVYDRKTNKHIKQIITQYRCIKYGGQITEQENKSFVQIGGILGFAYPINLNEVNKTDTNFHKKYNLLTNELSAEFSYSHLIDKNKKFLGYTFKYSKLLDTYNFSGKNMDFSNLIQYNSYKNMLAKRKTDENFSSYIYIMNFYPSMITYKNKDELEKGVKFDKTKSNFYSNFWEDSYYSNLYKYISNPSIYSSYQLKNVNKKQQ